MGPDLSRNWPMPCRVITSRVSVCQRSKDMQLLLRLNATTRFAVSAILQAEALRSKAQRPETARQQQQLARYLYYLGRIQTIQLDYTEAKDSLQQAARKVPAASDLTWTPGLAIVVAAPGR